MKTGKAGIELIKHFEGCRLKAYRCPAGKWTIGWGHTYGVRDGDTWTQEHADAMLLFDIGGYENAVMRYVRVPLNQNQFDALVSFAYNNGVESLKTSTLLKRLNAGDYMGAALEFTKWCHASVNGKMVSLPGLVRRRCEEKALFLTPDAESSPAESAIA